ncbi:MAG TPA: UDP-N-acetylglucosamine 2-epimerase (hydrolyzing) [Candidatus Paraprevotella stercorigallinarum]|nr:UDP-N-acetylglucosamine 2-epimerase (hydrolyzing) [Candidatus Paraprevotella stercorigallinarum]
MRKICVVTGSRAEYGLLSGLMHAIQEDKDLQLQVIATNMHLSPEFGLTYREIEKDGFRIDKKVQMLLSSDTPNATTKSVGLATIGFADAYEDLQPDLIVVLGDRFEILAAVSAALFFKIPVAHLHGGEITEGAYDDSIRHAITKMSHLHFTSTEAYRQRVIQLGEQPDRVFYVGAIGVENIKRVPLMSQAELEDSIRFKLGEKSLLVTYHPVTLENHTAADQCQNLLEALDEFPEYKVIFTLPNSDTDGRVIIRLINEYVSLHSERCMAIPSLGLQRYLSALKCVSAVVGNSSSGIIEVPSFGIPTLDIGNRQKGRIAAESVVHCGNDSRSIIAGMQQVLSDVFRKQVKHVLNPYEKRDTTKNIYKIISTYPLENLRQKKFYDVN